MAKYLYKANYTEKGMEGLRKEGGSARRKAVAKAVESMGGTLEAFYYAFGGVDVFAIVDLPDNATAVAFSGLVSAGGGATVNTTVLITPQEVDEAIKKTGDYRPPGK
jgi:uncharacterized protein with GYD domain